MAVGDQRGILQLVSIRRGGEPFMDFKVDLNSPINCLSTLSDVNGILYVIIIYTEPHAVPHDILGSSYLERP